MHIKLLLMAAINLVVIIDAALAQNQTVSTGCGANVGAVVNSNVALSVNCENNKTAQISVQYSRLFGAFEVPLMMELIPGPQLIIDGSFGQQFRAFQSSGGHREYAHLNLLKFVDRYPYKGAHPLLTPLWTDIVEFESKFDIAWRASAGLRSERICFFVAPLFDEGISNIGNPGVHRQVLKHSYCSSRINNFNSRVGFTFLIVSNDSDEPIVDVHFFFRQNYMSNRVVREKGPYRELHSYSVKEFSKIPATGSAIAELVKKHGSAGDTEALVSRQPKEFYFAARIEPKQKIIALLNVFFANEKNLPAGYFYGIYIFDEMEFTYAGSAQKTKIRPPSLERAARIQVPFGWASQ